MKNFNKILSALVATAMSASIAIVPVSAKTFVYENEASALYKLGLYKGVNETYFDPDLEAGLDRQTGVVMLLRMFGQEDEAKAYTYERADRILSKFRDAGNIATWSKRQVAYAVEKGYVKGYSEDSTFRPTNPLNGKAYCSLILQQLGYDGDFQYDRAATKLSDVGGLTSVQANTFNSDAGLIKDYLVGISYGALQAKYKSNGEELIRVLVKNGDITRQMAKDAGFPYADIVSVASIKDVEVEIGSAPKLPSTVKANYDDGTTEDVNISWPRVDTSKAGEQTISGTISGTSITAKVKVIVLPDELSVRSVSAPSLKELIVKFNGPIENEEEAKNKNNYDVENNSVLNAELSEDRMTVALLLKNALHQQDKVEITIDKAVGLNDDTEWTIDSVKDITVPSIVEVEAVGNALLKVTFSEPVQNASTISNYMIDGKLFGSSQPELLENAKTVIFQLTRTLSSGTHKLTVKDKISDYAGFSIEDNDEEFTVTEDKKAPSAVIKSATQIKVVVAFNEEVQAPELKKVHTNTGSRIEGIDFADDKKTLTVYFDIENALPAAGGKIEIDDVTDFSGNSVDIELMVTPSYDVKRPEFVGYAIENQKEIVLEFSEEVFSKYGKFKMTDDDDKVVNLTSAAYYKDDDDEYVKTKLVLKREDGKAFESGKYDLVISEVTDLNPLKNEILKKEITVSVDDRTPPSVSSVYINEHENQIFVKFNEDVDKDTATNHLNYYYFVSNVANKLNKDTMDVDLLSDDQTVCITFPFGDDYDDDEIVLVRNISRLQVESVEDVKGNEMSAVSVNNSDFRTENQSAPRINTAVVTDKNTIVVGIRGSIDENTLNPDDFYIIAGRDQSGNDVVIDAWDANYDSEKNEIELTVNADIETNGTFNGRELYLHLEDQDDIDTMNTFKQKLTLDSALRVSEDFKPVATSIASSEYEAGVGTVIYVELSENLRLRDNEIINANDMAQFRVKADGRTVPVKIYYYDADDRDVLSTDVDEKKARFKIVIEREDYTDERVQVIFFAGSTPTILDYAGNGLGDFDFTDTVR